MGRRGPPEGPSLHVASSCGLGFLTSWRFQRTCSGSCRPPAPWNQTRAQGHVSGVHWRRRHSAERVRPSSQGGLSPLAGRNASACAFFIIYSTFVRASRCQLLLRGPQGVLGDRSSTSPVTDGEVEVRRGRSLLGLTGRMWGSQTPTQAPSAARHPKMCVSNSRVPPGPADLRLDSGALFCTSPGPRAGLRPRQARAGACSRRGAQPLTPLWSHLLGALPSGRPVLIEKTNPQAR